MLCVAVSQNSLHLPDQPPWTPVAQFTDVQSRGGGLRVDAAASDSATAPSAKNKCASQASTLEVQLHTAETESHESANNTSRVAVSQVSGGSCSAQRGFAPGLPSSSRSILARTDGVFRYVRLPRRVERSSSQTCSSRRS